MDESGDGGDHAWLRKRRSGYCVRKMPKLDQDEQGFGQVTFENRGGRWVQRGSSKTVAFAIHRLVDNPLLSTISRSANTFFELYRDAKVKSFTQEEQAVGFEFEDVGWDVHRHAVEKPTLVSHFGWFGQAAGKDSALWSDINGIDVKQFNDPGERWNDFDVDDPEELLQWLSDASTDPRQRLAAVCRIESLSLSEKQRERFLRAMDSWIDEVRFTDVDDELTAVCSAIRKYSMNMSADRFARYGTWLTPSKSKSPHHDVELELSKGVCWHMRYLQTIASEPMRTLQFKLIGVAIDYMRPRLMLNKNYASTAKFAILGCLLIDARLGEVEVARDLWRRKTELEMNWFDRLIRFELRKTLKTLDKREPEFAKAVRELVDVVSGGAG